MAALHTHRTPSVAKEDRRPIRDLLLQMPLLPVSAEQAIDYPAADPALLVQVGDNAEAAMQTIQLGLSAVGTLLAHAAPEIETSDINANVIEALGWFIADASDFAATAHCLAAGCRRYTADYSPPTPRTIGSVKP